jgi:hypothetical protein
MTTQDMRYAISVDAQQADAELARLHREATTLAGAENKLAASTTKATAAVVAQGNASDATAESTKKATAAVVEHGKATAATAAKTETLQQRVAKLPDVLGKQAAAISLVSSSLADQNGWVGKAVAGAGQMAAAYGAGGPFALALVGGLALVSAFTSHLEKLNREQDEAIASLYGPVEAAIEQRKKAERDIAELRRDAAGPETTRQAFERVQGEIDGVEKQIQALIASRNALKIGTSGYDEARQQHQLQIQQLQATIELLEIKQNLEQGKAAKGTTLPKASGTSAKPEATVELNINDLYGDSPENLQAFVDRETARDEILQEGIELTKAREKEKFEILERMEQDAEKERLRIAEKAAQDREALRMSEVAQMQGYANLATGIVASAGTQLVADLVGQQEQALERFGVSVMAQAGQALVSYGAQAIGRGILEMSSPATAPLAAASFAAGGVLLGAGIGLGGVAGGLGTLMGGSSGSPGPSERGVSSGFSGGATGGSGGTNITIVYGGASGPTADHAARAVSDSVTRAGARGLNRDEVR